eukprot:948119-Ditylum_brightwellii.AAC.1
MPSNADFDVWMKDCKDHWEYVCTWVDDLLYAGRNEKAFYDAQCELKYQLNSVSVPMYPLGGDFKTVTEPESMLTWGAQTYAKMTMASYEQLFGELVPKEE